MTCFDRLSSIKVAGGVHISSSIFLLFLLLGFTLVPERVSAFSPVPKACTLPSYGNWNTGTTAGGYNPSLQLDWLRAGHRIAPWFALLPPDSDLPITYYEKVLKEVRVLGLPITFVSTQWEFPLAEQPYTRIRNETNPNVLGSSAVAANEKRLSPFGSKNYWYDVGYSWTNRNLFKKLSAIYPDPPSITFLSNNEQPVLGWGELERDKRYSNYAKSSASDDEKRRLAIDLWKNNYSELQRGMRDGLAATPWKGKLRFVGFLANGNTSMGRDSGWQYERLYTDDQIDPYAQFWDGSSFALYYNSEKSMLRDAPFSAMNTVLMLAENRKAKNSYYAEMSIWDGHTYDKNDWRRAQEVKKPGTSLPSYVAIGTLGMWLMKPEVVREFRFFDERYKNNQEYTDQIQKRIDEIASNTDLKSFWCSGEILPNRSVAHPYQAAIPEKYKNKARWYFLNVDPGNSSPERLNSNSYLGAIALRMGTTPNRRWLVYAYSVGNVGKNTQVVIPDYGSVTVAYSASGKYSLVNEKDKSVRFIGHQTEP